MSEELQQESVESLEGLTLRQRLFVAEYIIDGNGSAAAKRAGYSEHSAREQAVRLLADVAVARAVEVARARRIGQAELSAVRVLEELRRLSFVNVAMLFDPAGNLKPISQLTVEECSCIASIEIIKKNVAAGDGIVDTVHKVKLYDKVKSLELLAKHYQLLTDVVKLEAGDSLIAALHEGRARAAERTAQRRAIPISNTYTDPTEYKNP